MIALWNLLFFCPYFFSWANPLVAPRLNLLASSEFKSYSIPPPPSFLFPSPRASVIVDTSAPMFSFAILPLLAYSTILAIFGFISVRIARWRRGHRPAALTLDDDDVELLPTNTSTLSPEFKAFPVPPPLPSLVPSHARSRSFSNLQHAVAVHDMPERERPKSPLHFGLSSPGSRLKSKQRSHSAGSISSPLSPKRRLHNNNNRRPFISDPESDADTVIPQHYAIVSTPNTPFAPQTQFGTLVDLSVPPVPVSSPLNPIFPNMAGSTHLWALNSYTQSSSVPAEELNLIDLHAPDLEKRASWNPEPVSVHLLRESKGSKAKEQGNTSSDLDGYEPDVEGEAGEQSTGLGKDKEIDIGLEWGFESVSGSSKRMSSISQPQQVSEERDLVDGNSIPSSPVEFLATQLHPIPITASSSLSGGYVRLDTEEFLSAGKSEDSLPLSSSSSSAILSSSSSPPSPPRHLVELDAGHRPIDAVIVENTGVEDEDEVDLNVDNGTLPSISRGNTSLDSDLIHRVYIDDNENAAGQLELGPGMFIARDRQHNELYDLYENNDRVEGDEYAEDAEAEEFEDQGMRRGVDITRATQDDDVDVLTYTDNSSTNPESQEAMQDLSTPPSSQEKIATLASGAPDNDVELELRIFEDGVNDEPQANEGVVNAIEDDFAHIEETEGEFPDPDLLPLPELDIPLLLANITSLDSSPAAKQEESSSPAATAVSVSPTSQIPTPPASPPQQRRPLPRPLPAWSIRAADAPPLGLASRSPLLRHKSSFSLSVIEGSDARVAKEPESELKTEIEIQEKDEEGISSLSDEIIESEDVRTSTKTPVPSAATLPGAFPVDVHPLSGLIAPDDDEEEGAEETTTEETESSSSSTQGDEPVLGSSTGAAPSTSTSVIKPVKRHPARSPIDIALAMQLRPGLGLGADPAWMVRFLMAMFGWFVVLISGSAGDGYGRTPYVGIRRSEE